MKGNDYVAQDDTLLFYDKAFDLVYIIGITLYIYLVESMVSITLDSTYLL